ncbi:MAG: type II secretion system protein GspK, partial [Haliea sp.]
MHCRRSELRLPNPQRGVALVVALLVFGLSAALLVAMQSEFTLFYQRGSNLFVAEQGQAYLRGAEELATMALVMDHDADQAREQPRDDLTEVWAQQATPYPLDEGGWLVGSLEDLQGRFNLNTLAAGLAGFDAGGENARFT